MDVIGAKLIALFVLLIEVLLFGFIPLACVNAVRTQDQFSLTRRIISWLSCFAGGVFFATSMLHMLPEVRELIEEGIEGMGWHIHFAVAEFTTAIGFFLILVTETIAIFFHKRAVSSEVDDNTDEPVNEATETTALLDASVSIDDGDKENFHGKSPEDETTVLDHHHHEHTVVDGGGSTLRSIMFLLALSLHSVFEGMAIGLQSDVAGTMELFLAIALHKGIVAFSFSLNLIQSKLSKCGMIMSVITFAIMSPIGVAIGMIVSSTTSTGPEAVFANGILQALATGTFFYVTFFEILPHELNVKRDEILKVLFVIVGFAVMTVIDLAVPHHH
ncbi:zinc transporter ZIP1-like [Ptychodera flava]|uniref:zinc transporter ZIP1-like n=1 Tax=Ptychodera flava TaxID=63121 RepID=UPI00396A56D3